MFFYNLGMTVARWPGRQRDYGLFRGTLTLTQQTINEPGQTSSRTLLSSVGLAEEEVALSQTMKQRLN
jgi:hypothetical protein